MSVGDALGRQERGEEWPSGCSPLHPQLRSGERIKLIPLLCIACTSVVWGFALFFFFQGLSTWQVSGPPAGGGRHPQSHPTSQQLSCSVLLPVSAWGS